MATHSKKNIHSVIVEFAQMGDIVLAHIQLNSPERANSIGVAIAEGLSAGLKEVKKKKASFAFITSVYGDSTRRIFSGGGDLKAYAALQSKAAGVTLNRRMTKILGEMERLPTIFVALVDGLCIGGGCELVLSCDRILITERARFQFGQARVGLTPGWGGGQRLTKRVSHSRALEWLATAREILPSEALASELADEIVESSMVFGEEWGSKLLRSKGQELAKFTPHSGFGFLASKFTGEWNTNPLVLAQLKSALRSSSEERRAFEKLWWSSLHREKLRGFVEK